MRLFSERFDYEVSDFTVLVGRPEPLAAIYEEVTGAKQPTCWASERVFSGRDGRTFLVVVSGSMYTPLSPA